MLTVALPLSLISFRAEPKEALKVCPDILRSRLLGERDPVWESPPGVTDCAIVVDSGGSACASAAAACAALLAAAFFAATSRARALTPTNSPRRIYANHRGAAGATAFVIVV